MSNKRKGIIGIFIFSVVAAAMLINCSSDIVIEAPLSLLGEYEGKYDITDLNQNRTTTFDIEIRFSDQKYWIKDPFENLCEPSGFYEFSSQVTFDQENAGTTNVCDASLNPEGTFSFRKPGDSLILTQEDSGIIRQIRMTKK